jgi:hypothetical protein
MVRFAIRRFLDELYALKARLGGVVSKDQESNISDDVVDRVLGHLELLK